MSIVEDWGMSEQDELIALLGNSRSRWQTVRARGTEWRRQSVLHVAFTRGVQAAAEARAQRVASSGGASAHQIVHATVNRADGTEPPDESIETWGYWEDARRTRAEFSVGDETVVVVYEGDTFWSWSPSRGARTNAGRTNEEHGLGAGRGLVDTAVLLPQLRFRVLGRSELIGRSALHVSAEPRPSTDDMWSLDLSDLGLGADEYLLAVDEERGVILRCEARLENRPFKVLEMSEVSFDEDLPADTFEIDLPEGEEFDGTVEFESVTLEQLPNRVPFKVFALSGHFGRPRAHIDREKRGGKRVVEVMTTYHLPNGLLWLLQSDEADAVADPDDDWHQRGELTVCEEQEADRVRCKVRLVRQGTALHLESTGATLNELIAIADSIAELH
jgi:outer membrane lipoprotein-sorting protein